jgi:hypothetical protein
MQPLIGNNIRVGTSLSLGTFSYYYDMEERELAVKVRLSVQRALLGTITPNIRLITIDWDALKSFRMRVYYDVKPSEDDIEEMEAVISEVVSDIPFETAPNVEAIHDLRPRSVLEIFKYTVFARKE